jgi:hypothetical protein
MLDTAVAIAAIATPIAAVLAGFFAILAITHQIRESEKKTRLKLTHESLRDLFDWLSPYESFQAELHLLQELLRLNKIENPKEFADRMNVLSFALWKRLTKLRGAFLDSIPLVSCNIIEAVDRAIKSIVVIDDAFRNRTLPGSSVDEARRIVNKVLWDIEIYIVEFYQSSFNPLSSKTDYRCSKKKINEIRSGIDRRLTPISPENQR